MQPVGESVMLVGLGEVEEALLVVFCVQVILQGWLALEV